MKIYREQSR